jgi:hypothetical protein
MSNGFLVSTGDGDTGKCYDVPLYLLMENVYRKQFYFGYVTVSYIEVAT